MLDINYKTFTNLPFSQNGYLVFDNSGKALIIDPGGSFVENKKFIEERLLTPKAILLTHGHPDHLAAAELFITEFKIKCYLHENELSILQKG